MDSKLKYEQSNLYHIGKYLQLTPTLNLKDLNLAGRPHTDSETTFLSSSTWTHNRGRTPPGRHILFQLFCVTPPQHLFSLAAAKLLCLKNCTSFRQFKSNVDNSRQADIDPVTTRFSVWAKHGTVPTRINVIFLDFGALSSRVLWRFAQN